MSPPTKAPLAPDLDRQSEGAGTDTLGAGAHGAPALAPPHAAVLGGQQAAGNRAMAAVLAAPRGVQRAPGDEDPRTSGMASGPTLDSSGGVAIAPTLVDPRRSGMASGPTLDSSGGVAISPTLVDPRRSGMAHGPTLDSSGGVGTAPTVPGPGGAAPVAPGGAGGAPLGGAPTGAGSESAGDFSPQAPSPRRTAGRHPDHIKPPVPVPQSEAEDAYRRDPSLVHRSTNQSIHRQHWHIDPRAGGGPPPVFRSGKTYIVHPDVQSPALPPRTESVEADEGMEARNVRDMSAHLDKSLASKRGPAPQVAPRQQAPPVASPVDAGAGHTTEPFKPIAYERQPWAPPGPSSIPGGLQRPPHLGDGGGGTPPPTGGPPPPGPAGPGTMPGTGIEPRTPAPVGSPTVSGTGIEPKSPAPGAPVPDPSAIRNQRVAEGMADMDARTARRVERSNVQPISDPNEAARIYLDQRGGAGGNVAVGRRDMFEDKWRYDHHQNRQAPPAGWRNADGTVVIDKSNPQVRDAVERLARERGGGGAPAPPPGGAPKSGAPPPTPAPGSDAPVPAAPVSPRPPLAATGAGTSPPPGREPQTLGATGVGTGAPPPRPGVVAQGDGSAGRPQGPTPGPAFQPAMPGTTGGGPARAWPNPQPVQAGEFAGVDPKEKITPIPKPREAMRAEVEPLGQIDPRRVIKSPNENWHYNAWHHSRGPYYYGKDAPAPQFFKVGDTYYASPKYEGPGTVLPNYSGTEGQGLGKPAIGAPAPGPGPGSGTTAPAPTTGTPAPPDKLRQAVAPYTPFTGEPRGTQRAQPVTRSDVMAALAADPNSVVQSPNDRFHRQGYRTDGGGREAPGAYRVGNLYVVSPDYPVEGVRKLSVPGSPAPGAPAGTPGGTPTGTPAPTPAPDPTKAVQTISPTGFVPQEKKPAKWDVKQGAVSRESTTDETKVTPGGTDTRSRSSKQSLSATTAGQEWKQREETRAGDTVVGKEKFTKATLGPDGITIMRGRSSDEGRVTADDPDAAKKTKTKVEGGAILGPDGVGGTGGAAIESKSGAKAEAKGTAKMGKEGLEASGTAGLTSAKGFTGHLTVSGKHHVVASDPKKTEKGTFAVTFTVTDEKGVNLGGGWNKPGGGMSVGLSVGSSTRDIHFETRVFDSEAEAKVFQVTAAFRVTGETKAIDKASTADGALAMKEGEVAGKSTTDTDTLGGSAGMGQVSVGVAKTDATTRGLRIEKVSPTKVRVTPSVSEQEALNASISAAGLFSNTKGGSETNSFAITYEFDLSSDAGKKVYETYLKQAFPPPMPPHAKWIDSTTGHQIEDHDVYKFTYVGEIGWGSHASQQTVVDEAGTHTTAVGGQSEKVELNSIRKLTFDKNRHAEANIIGRMSNGQVTSIAGQLTVGGEDGAFNREQFRKIFSDKGAPAGTSVTTSGEWTLSADIDKKVFEDLSKTNDDMKRATTKEERLKIYSELAQKGGAQMLSGQVRASGKKLAWNLELKGDPNFPGAAGRAQLNAQRAKLVAQLKERPDSAGSIAAEAKEAIGALSKRLTAVGDKKKYTDLPDELRQEQVDLINTHIAEFKSLRSQSLSVQMRGGRKEDLTVVLRRAADENGYADVKMEDRAWRKAQDLVTIHETELHALEGEIVGTRGVVQRMFLGTGDVRWGKGVHKQVFLTYNAKAKEKMATFKSMAPRLTEAVGKMRAQKEKWSAEPDPKAREHLLREYDAYVMAAIQIMDVQLIALRDVAKEASVVASDAAVGSPAAVKVLETAGADKTARLNAGAGLDVDGSPIE